MASVRRSRLHKSKTVPARVPRGSLLIIGGKENKSGQGMRILKRVAELTQRGRLVVATAATELPNEVYIEYRDIFRSLGIKKIDHLHLETADDARKAESIDFVKNAETVFFSGGDQLKITTKIGGSALLDAIYDLHKRGGTVAGTSAGAAVMGETMLLGGGSMDTTESHKIGGWLMAPGLSLVKNIIIDQHFGQRARIGRLLGAVALNPRVLGIGIDEDTSILVQDGFLEVLGSNAVYVIDGHEVTYTNMAESATEHTMSLHDVKLHILADGERFDLRERRPYLRGELEALSKKRIEEGARAEQTP